jgi:hypothetical protein
VRFVDNSHWAVSVSYAHVSDRKSPPWAVSIS